MDFKLLKNVDYTDALERVGNDKELYVELLLDFIQNYSDSAKEYIASIKDKKNDDALRIIHTVKGLTGTLGAKKLAEISKKLEQYIKDRNSEGIKKIHPVFASELREIVAEMSAFVESGEPKKVNLKSIDRLPLIRMLKDLKQLVESKRAAKIKELMDKLSEYTYSSSIDSELLTLATQLKKYNFKLAIQTITTLLTALNMEK